MKKGEVGHEREGMASGHLTYSSGEQKEGSGENGAVVRPTGKFFCTTNGQGQIGRSWRERGDAVLPVKLQNAGKDGSDGVKMERNCKHFQEGVLCATF